MFFLHTFVGVTLLLTNPSSKVSSKVSTFVIMHTTYNLLTNIDNIMIVIVLLLIKSNHILPYSVSNITFLASKGNFMLEIVENPNSIKMFSVNQFKTNKNRKNFIMD